MRFNPDIHKRRSIRLKTYDYGSVGAYFVTIVCQNRTCLFGTMSEGDMYLNSAGQMVDHWWNELSRKYPQIETDAFVIMPNHIHGIIIIHPPVGATLRGRPDVDVTVDDGNVHREKGHPHFTKLGVKPWGAPTVNQTLGEMVGWFKTMTTNAYIRGVKENGWEPFDKRLWQHNYFEHIIRNEDDLQSIRDYILYNPKNWLRDKENAPMEIA